MTFDRTRGSGLKPHQGRFRLDIRKKGWSSIEQTSQGGVKSPNLEVYKKQLDVALSSMVKFTTC